MILPADFINNIKRDYKPLDAEKILESYQSIENKSDQSSKYPIRHSIRLNQKKVSKLDNEQKSLLDDLLIDSESIPWSKNGHYLKERPDYSIEPLYKLGVYYPQESSSMILEWFFRELQKNLLFKKELKILDLCSAPGGKSLILADLLELESGDCLISNEINPHRNKNLREVVSSWETNNIIITKNKPTSFEKMNEFFDYVIVDAPCSGEGMFRKNPETIAEWSLKNVEINARRQREILHSAACTLSVSGILVYSTCTLNKQENEEIAEWLESNYDMEVIEFENLPNDQTHQIIETKKGCYHLINPFVQGEGLFVVTMQKKSSLKIDHKKRQEENQIWAKLKGRKLNNNPKSTSWQKEAPIIHYENNQQIIHAWQAEYPNLEWSVYNLTRLDEIDYILIPKTLKSMYEIINDNLSITRSPVELGTLYRRDIKTLKKFLA